MPLRTAQARWEGDLRSGHGHFSGDSGAIGGEYTFGTRFGDDRGTNPEELIGAAHASCFSMALAAALTSGGHVPRSITTSASVQLEKDGGGFSIKHIALKTEGDVPGIDEAAFKSAAEDAKKGCPVSKALAAVDITLDAHLKA